MQSRCSSAGSPGLEGDQNLALTCGERVMIRPSYTVVELLNNIGKAFVALELPEASGLDFFQKRRYQLA